MSIKKIISTLKPSATLAINEYSNELLKQGKRIYKLGFGQSPFPVPQEVVNELIAHAHEKDYLPVRGLYLLRKAVAAYHSRKINVSTAPEDVLIGPGSKELLFVAQLCFDGDLIVPAPSWVSYSPQAQITQKECHWIDTSANGNKLLDASMLQTFCLSHPEQRFMVILNYPSNPTGATYTIDQLKAISDVAKQNNLLVISDEIYGELAHDGEHRSLAEFYPEGTIVSSGLSKWCGAGGWRLGTFTFPKELRGLSDAMAVVASETFTATSAPIQYAAVKAFEFGPNIESYLNHARAILKYIAQYVYTELTSVGLTMPEPEGGFYLFPDFEKFKEKLNKRGITTSSKLCRTILEETGVALLPGVDFGQAPEELSARLSYVDFDGKKALDVMKKEGRIKDIHQVAPNIVAACQQLKGWLS